MRTLRPLAVLLALAAAHFNVFAAPPNIVFILVDDLGYADMGFNGSKFYETPAIDALANDGLVFNHAYMYPTCSPSRTALATGKDSYRTGVYTVPALERGNDRQNIFSRWTVGEDHIMYSQPLAEAGYKAIHLGKWHLVGPYPREEATATFPLTKKLGQPDAWDFSFVEFHKSAACRKYYPEGRGYLKNVGGTYRGDPALEVGWYESETGGYFAPFSNPFMEQMPDDEWLTDRLTDDAIDFMKEHKEGPFFINLHYYTVHRPLRARSEKLLRKYLEKAGDPTTGQGMRSGEEKILEARYATMIESLDDNVARITEFLDREGLRLNTLILFTSDNGQNPKANGLNHVLRGGKGEIYEGGIRVPTFANWPGKIKPRRTDTAIHATDYFPTFMNLAGIEYDGQLDGRSFRSLFESEDPALSGRALFWHLASRYKHGTCSVIRKDHLKLIQFLKDGKLELYDLSRDPREEKNLADEKPEIAQRLLEQLVQWRKDNDVPLPPESPLDH
ncbi:MAG: sulfatase [Verrucomicrobiales bacterium]|nr:sulfatase [Verrucomicrobiales bacterium]